MRVRFNITSSAARPKNSTQIQTSSMPIHSYEKPTFLELGNLFLRRIWVLFEGTNNDLWEGLESENIELTCEKADVEGIPWVPINWILVVLSSGRTRVAEPVSTICVWLRSSCCVPLSTTGSNKNREVEMEVRVKLVSKWECFYSTNNFPWFLCKVRAWR